MDPIKIERVQILRYVGDDGNSDVLRFLSGFLVDIEGIKFNVTCDPLAAMLVTRDELRALNRFFTSYSSWNPVFPFMPVSPAMNDSRVSFLEGGG